MNTTEICYLSAVEQLRALDAGDFSVCELVDAHIERIESINPALNAFVTLCLEQARETAAQADRDRASDETLGVLHGLPLGVKDCFQTAGVRTTMACLALRDEVPGFDHLVVEREKAAGAIILGKLNTPEFTMARNTCSSELFGSTRNPHDLSLCPGASSGGSGAALAAGLCALADGSDIGGSVRNPAGWCNIVGHRPTTWTIPDVPNPRLWHNMNTAGPMARTVEDVALFLSALAGPDPRCPVPLQAPFAPGLPELDRDFKGFRVGWTTDYGSIDVDPDIAERFRAQLGVFEELGCELEEFELDIAELEACYDGLVYRRVCADTREVFERAPDELAPTLRERQLWFDALTASELEQAEQYRLRVWHDVVELFGNYDLLLSPNDPIDPFGHDDDETGFTLDWRLLYLAPLLNLPACTVPCGFSVAGVPRGLHISGRPGQDLAVLQLAYAYQQSTRFGERRPALDA